MIDEQRKEFDHLLKLLREKISLKESSSNLIIGVGKLFLGRPYKKFHKEPEKYFNLNLKEFDCFTFIEHVVGIVLLLKSGLCSFEAFLKILQRIGYRGGKVGGYPSRLHYFSDWVYDNQRKGFLIDVTKEIRGKSFSKTINYMSEHIELYPWLRTKKNLIQIRDVEKDISKRRMYFIPKELFKASENKLNNGDIIGITTNKRGLDVQHVGIAIRIRGRIHLLHASSKEGMVLISKETLYRYLIRSKSRTGIMVARIC